MVEFFTSLFYWLAEVRQKLVKKLKWHDQKIIQMLLDIYHLVSMKCADLYNWRDKDLWTRSGWRMAQPRSLAVVWSPIHARQCVLICGQCETQWETMTGGHFLCSLDWWISCSDNLMFLSWELLIIVIMVCLLVLLITACEQWCFSPSLVWVSSREHFIIHF